jgi:hypothetical protein
MRNRSTLAHWVLGVVLVGATAPTAASDDIPRTASGRPDLSGTYDIASLTAFERDPRYGDRLFLTAAEAAEIERTAAMGMAFANRASDPEREAPPSGGDGSAGAAGKVGGYNAFWIDPGTRTLPLDGQFRTSVLVDPPDGRLPEVSEAGHARRASLHPYFYENTADAWWLETGDDPYDGPESLSLLDRCLYVGVATVPARSVLYNNLKTVVQTDDYLMILVEWMHWARIIPIQGEHRPAELPSLDGDAIAWWEGDTLVVESVNFLDIPGVRREGLRVVERFSRQDKDTLRYQFTVHDPDYVAPYSGELPWPSTGDRLYEFACHEGNYAMGNILRGARLLEKEALARKSGALGAAAARE